MASPMRHSKATKKVAHPFSERPGWKPELRSKGPGVPSMTALRMEFVAKPQEAHRVGAAIPAAISSALNNVDGFAGCLVMISDQEARLVTVVTLWAGDGRAKRCRQNVPGLQALLAPYVDRCLRVQTMLAHLPVSPLVRLGTQETDDFGKCSLVPGHFSTEETVCVA
jgi:hypothetical protein